MNLPWYDKHAPRELKEIIGQGTARVLECVRKNKTCLITGPSGTGKTVTAHAIAHECGMQLVELSADEKRNKDYINSVLSNTLVTKGLFGKKLVLVDDVDLLDRGGMPELIKCIKKSMVPVILTARDKWDKKLRTLRNYCEIIEYRKLRTAWTAKVLKRISEEEGIKVSDENLYKIAVNAIGDLRAAINDLELLGKDGEITNYEVKSLTYREKPISIHEGLTRLFNATSFEEAHNSLINVEMDINEKMLWISENASKNSYNNLSRADVFIGRVRRWQYYRYWAYANALMTAGVKGKSYYGFSRPSKIMKLWKSKSERVLRDNVLTLLKERIHASKKKIMSEHLPYLKVMCKNKEFKNSLISELGLSPKEAGILS